MAERIVLGRRHLLVLGAAATVHSACGSDEAPLGGPYGGTATNLPGPKLGDTDSGVSVDDAGGGQPEAGNGSSSGGESEAGSGGDAAGCTGCATGSNVVAFTFAQYPQLQQVGGNVQTAANGYSDPKCGSPLIIVFQASAGQYTALSMACTHACCPVSFTGTGFKCPCHGATFDLTGKPTNNVTSTPLASLPVCSDSCGVYVTV